MSEMEYLSGKLIPVEMTENELLVHLKEKYPERFKEIVIDKHTKPFDIISELVYNWETSKCDNEYLKLDDKIFEIVNKSNNPNELIDNGDGTFDFSIYWYNTEHEHEIIEQLFKPQEGK